MGRQGLNVIQGKRMVYDRNEWLGFVRSSTGFAFSWGMGVAGKA